MNIKTIKYLLITSLTAASVSVIAQPKSDKGLLICSNIKKNDSRLHCYDEYAKWKGLSPKGSNSKTSISKWHVSEELNPLDDSKTVVLTLQSSNKISNGYKEGARLIILRCKSNKTTAYISWDDYLGSSSYTTTRIDQNKAISSTWDVSTDSKAAFSPNAIGFIKSMFKGERLIARTTPYGESPKILTFDISGIEEAIKPLRQTCNW